MKISLRTSITASFICFLWLCHVYFPEVVDDAYITLKYSKNVIEGNGPVFNIGEKVEGFSNFSWMIILAFFGKIGLPMHYVMKVLSILCGILTITLTYWMAKKFFKGNAAKLFPVLVLSLSSFLALWSTDGLETMFYTMLLTYIVYALSAKNCGGFAIGVAAALLVLTRPEGIMFAVLAVIYLYFRRGLLDFVVAGAVVTVTASAYELFRYFYYGHLVSNVAYHKVHAGIDSLILGAKYFMGFSHDSGYILVVLAAVGMFLVARKMSPLILILFLFAQLFFLVVSGGDYMYGYRFIVPVIPIIALLAGFAIDYYSDKSRIHGLIIMAAVIAVTAIFQYSSLPEKRYGIRNFNDEKGAFYDLTDYLKNSTTKDDYVLINQVGVVGYYTDVAIIDDLGLISDHKSITKYRDGEEGKYIDLLFNNSPKFVIIFHYLDSEGNQFPYFPFEKKIESSDYFLSNYEKSKSIIIPNGETFSNRLAYDLMPPAKSVSIDVYKRI